MFVLPKTQIRGQTSHMITNGIGVAPFIDFILGGSWEVEMRGSGRATLTGKHCAEVAECLSVNLTSLSGRCSPSVPFYRRPSSRKGSFHKYFMTESDIAPGTGVPQGPIRTKILPSRGFHSPGGAEGRQT